MEHGKEIIIGNVFDKYHSKNSIFNYLMQNFLRHFTDLIKDNVPLSILETGCGEGYLAQTIIDSKQVISYFAFDIDVDIVSEAQKNCPTAKMSVGSLYKLQDYYNHTFDYVITSEVLEHLENPLPALENLRNLSSRYFLFSVPKEPLWRVLNIMRFKYLSAFGNTPGHLQHWNKRSFVKMLTQYFKIVEVRTALPWTIVLCTKKHD